MSDLDLELAFATATDPGGVFAVLSTQFTVRAADARRARWTWLDTPDWRLRRSGMALREVRRGQRRELVLEAAGETWHGPCGRAHWPCRVEQLPPSEVRNRIGDIVGARAIVPLAEVEVRAIPLRLLDGLDKTRATGELVQHRLVKPRRAPLPLRLQLTPLRGYGADVERADVALRTALPIDGTRDSGRDRAVAGAGAHAGRPTEPPTVLITANHAAGRAVAVVLRQNLDMLEANRHAAAAGIDGIALHDLRVAVRASRAALRTVGDVLPSDLTGRFGNDIKWLGKISSRPRDLDMCLAGIDGQLGVATADLPLRTVREALVRRRRAAFGRFASALNGARADTFLTNWRDVLDQIIDADPPGPTVRDVVGPRARSTHRGLVRAGEKAIATHGGIERLSADELHALRLRAKELRYLLEGARPLCAPEPYKRLHDDVCALVSELGGVEDARVITAEIRDMARGQLRGPQRGSAEKVDPLLASGAFAERLRLRELDCRKRAAAAFDRLARPGSARRVARLLGTS